MSKLKRSSVTSKGWIVALLLTAVVAGCGGGGGSSTGSVAATAATTVLPGVAGTAGAAVTNPTVISASPPNGAVNVAISSTPGTSGTLVKATFNEAMNPATLNSATAGAVVTFTLKVATSGANVPGTVAMNVATVGTNVANTIATFTPTATALALNTQYTATVTTAAKSALGVSMPSTVAWSFTTGTNGAAVAQTSPDLGSASTYVVFASAAAVTLAVNATVSGDVGLVPAGACNNCVIGTTILGGGVIHNGDAAAIAARTDFNNAYVDAANRATSACPISPANLDAAQAACNGVTNGPTYVAGLYRTASPITISVGTTITLDAQNNPDAVFIFQSGAAITTGTNSVVVLANGAQAKNVWWMAGSAATLGVSSTFKGTVLANGAAVTVLGGTIGSPTKVEGRLFSYSAAADVNAFANVVIPK